jgi:hypothetical protein
MGEHYHTPFIYPDGQKSKYQCADLTCEFYNHQSLKPLWRLNFSAFTPDGIWQWKSYMEKEMPEEWEEFLFSIHEKDTSDEYTEILNVQLTPANLVQYLFDNLDSLPEEKREILRRLCK